MMGWQKFGVQTIAAAVLLWVVPCVAIAQSDNDPLRNHSGGVSNELVTDGVLNDTAWYDAESGQIVPIPVVPQTDDSMHRDSRWLPQAKRVAKPSTPTTSGGTTGGGTGGLFGSGLSVGNLLGWMLLIAIVAGAIALLLFAISKTEADLTSTKGRKSASVLKASDEQILERMKHLPAELRRSDVNLRSEAERLMREGHFDQAIILLFGHQLLLLDRVGMLRLNRGKTNRRYVRETRRADRDAARRLKDTVHAFERSYFGRHSITAQQFQELWESNQTLENAIEQRRGVAA